MSSKLLTVFGGGVPWLFREEFGSATTPAVSRSAIPGPGALSITDTGPLVSVAGGVAVIAGATVSFEDPRIIGTRAGGSGFSRTPGLAMTCAAKKDTVATGDESMVGWRSAVTGGASSLAHAHYNYRNDDRYYRGTGLINTAPYPTDEVLADEWVKVAIIVRASGCHLLKHVSGATWRRLWVDDAGTEAELWPSIQQATGLATGTYDNFEVRQLGTWSSDAMVAQVSSAAAGTFIHDAECWFDWVPGGVSRSLTFRRLSADNHLSLTIDGSGTLDLVQTIAGTPSTIATWAGSMTGSERVLVLVYDDNVYVWVNNTVRLNSTNTHAILISATAGELSDAAATFYVWRRTETLPFDSATPVPLTRLSAASGAGVATDEDLLLTAWAGSGSALDLAAPSSQAMAYAGVPWIAQTPGITATLPTTAPPYDIYLLVCRNSRAGGTILATDRGIYQQVSGPDAVFPPYTGVPSVNAVEVPDVAIAENVWQRVRIHVSGVTSFVQVEDEKSDLIDLGVGSIAGVVSVLCRTAGGGIHGWVAYLHILAGDLDGTYHAAQWAEMADRAAELSLWESSVVTADTKHNGFPGYAILADGSEIMAYRKGTAHADHDGIIVIRRRANSSAAWGAEETVLSVPGYDVRDVGLCQTPTGRVVLIGDILLDDDGLYEDVEAWAMYSDDGGDTWSSHAIMGHPWAGAATGGAPVVIGPNVYCPIWAHAGENPIDIGIAVSLDNGETWSADDFIHVADGTLSVGLEEPTLHVIGSEWCVLCRATDANTRLYTSTDSGSSWTYQGIVMSGKSPHQMVTLGDGRVLVVYRDSGPGFCNLHYRISSDALRTFTSGRSIKPQHTTTEYAMPVRRSDGIICVVASFTARVQNDPVVTGADIHYFERDEDDL